MNNNRQLIYIIIGIIIAPFVFIVLIPLFAIFFVIQALNPISETIVCTGIECSTTANLIVGTSTQGINERITDKNQLELQVVSDMFNINQYYIRMKNNNERYAFRTAYLNRNNAERDLRILKERPNPIIVKRNVLFIQGLCITFYIILLIIGSIINRVIQNNRNPNRSLYIHQNIEEENGTREN